MQNYIEITKNSTLDSMWSAYCCARSTQTKDVTTTSTVLSNSSRSPSYTASTTNPGQGAAYEQRIYTGHEYDGETGLYYMNARYQNPSTGRFVSQDPAFWALPNVLLANPQKQNSYTYADNNPVTMSDPTGELSKNTVTNILKGAMNGTIKDIKGAIGIITNYKSSVANAKSTASAIINHPVQSAKNVANGVRQDYNAYMAADDGGRERMAAEIFLTPGGILGKLKYARYVDDVVPDQRIHGNSLDSPKTNYGYELRDKETYDLLKYGETTDIKRRYSQAALDRMNARIVPVMSGSKPDIHQWQHDQIMQYMGVHGYRPPLNKSNW